MLPSLRGPCLPPPRKRRTLHRLSGRATVWLGSIAVAGAVLLGPGTARAHRTAELPAELALTEDGLPIDALNVIPDTPRGNALRLGQAMTAAAQRGDMDEARRLRRRYLALDPDILDDLPTPPLTAAIGATEQTPEVDSLELWTGAHPENEMVLVFWRPRRGDKSRLFAALEAEATAGGPPVVAIVADPTPLDERLSRAQAQRTPHIAMGAVRGAAADRWQTDLSQDCLYIENGVVVQRMSCRGLLPPPPPETCD